VTCGPQKFHPRPQLRRRRRQGKSILVMKPSKNRTPRDADISRKAVPMTLNCHRKALGWFRQARTEAHVRSTAVVVPNLWSAKILSVASATPVPAPRQADTRDEVLRGPVFGECQPRSEGGAGRFEAQPEGTRRDLANQDRGSCEDVRGCSAQPILATSYADALR